MLYLYFQILFRLIYQPVGYSGNSLSTNYSPLGKELDCDIHLVNLRTMTTGQTSPSDKTALIVHMRGQGSSGPAHHEVMEARTSLREESQHGLASEVPSLHLNSLTDVCGEDRVIRSPGNSPQKVN